jgi:hypothetical protein
MRTKESPMSKEEQNTRRTALSPPKTDTASREAMLKLIEEARQAVKRTVKTERQSEELPEAVASLRFK